MLLTHGLPPLSVADDGLGCGELHRCQAHRVVYLDYVRATAAVVGEAAAPLACIYM